MGTFLKAVGESVLLFLLSTVCAHALLFSMAGDSTTLRAGLHNPRLESEVEKPLLHVIQTEGASYLGNLKLLWNGLSDFTGDHASQTTDVRAIVFYLRPTLSITILAMIVYLVLTISSVLMHTMPIVQRILFAIPLIMSLVPIVVLSKFFQFSALSPYLDFELFARNTLSVKLGMIFLMGSIQAMGDGALIDGLKSIREAWVNVSLQPYIFYQRLIGGKVKTHLFRNMLPYLVSVSYHRFLQILGGTIIVEYVFNVKGLGWLTAVAVETRNHRTLFLITAITMVVVCMVSFIHRICLTFIDPRYSL